MMKEHVLVNKRFWYPLGLCLCLFVLAACGPTHSQASNHTTAPGFPTGTSTGATAAPSPALSIVQQGITATPAHSQHGDSLTPYGPPPAETALEAQLTQQLFNQINQDRSARGLYAYTWNATLASGARLHSWNMYHCGFSHTCPNGENQCTRIANEGFAGYSDCGECIGLAGPSSPPWKNVYSVQESMINEPPTGWHRIHLTSTTLHRVGVGIYVAPNGWVWFTEDLVS